MSERAEAVGRPHLLVVGGTDVEKRRELVRGLAGEFRVTVAGPGAEHREAFEGTDADYVAYPLKRGAAPLTDVRTLVRCYRLVRRLEPDIVHAFATKPSVWARIAARLAGAPVIVGTLPGRGSLYWASGPRVWVLRTVYRSLQAIACRCSDLTIFYNESDARTLIDGGVVPGERTEIVPGSGVPTDVFDPDAVAGAARGRLRRELGADGDEVVVTMVGRVIRTKGVLEFTRAAEALAGEGARTRFVLVGPHDPGSVDHLDPDELERVGRSVVWLGERADVREILAASDVFVLPSYGEGIPRAVMEAGSMGLPVVTTDVPGCREVVEDGVSGLLVPARDAAALTDAIRRLARDPDARARMGAAARRTAVDRYDTSVVVEQIASCYRRLLGRGSPAGGASAGVRETRPDGRPPRAPSEETREAAHQGARST